MFDDNAGWVYLVTITPNLAVNLGSLHTSWWSLYVTMNAQHVLYTLAKVSKITAGMIKPSLSLSPCSRQYSRY